MGIADRQRRVSADSVPAPEPEYLLLREAAARYRLSVRSLMRYISTGELRPANGAHRIGGRWFILADEFEARFIDRPRPSRLRFPARAS
jgi:hypothetical protein